VEVTPNLFAALRSIRHTSDKVCFWVDALCTNQDDDQEKAAQIKRMTEIYANSTVVFMWLGEEEDESELAMTLLQRLGNFVYAHLDRRNMNDYWLMNRFIDGHEINGKYPRKS
jgi:hypothetical protein